MDELSVRGRLLGWKKAVSGGGGFSENPVNARAAAYALNFLMGLTMAAARVFDMCGPFGIGMVAQAGAGAGGVWCTVGAAAGYLLSGGFDWGIKYVATIVLVFTASFMFQTARIYETRWFMPLVAAAITAVTGFLNSLGLSSPIPPAVLILTEVTLAGGSAYFFGIALSGETQNSESEEIIRGISLLIMLSCALMAVSGLRVMGVISIGRTVAVLLVMMASYKGSMTSGAAAGAALGLAMDVAAGGVPFFTMAYSFSGMLSGIFQRNGKLFFLLSYILANAASVLWTWGESIRLEALYEVFAASVVFMVLPAAVPDYIGGVFRHTQTGEGESGLRRYTADRAKRMGEAFRDLHETVRRTMEPPSNDNDIAAIFDRAADSVCADCEKSGSCWHEQYVDTLNTMNDATDKMLKRGKLERDDLSAHFLERCDNTEAFIGAVNGELRGLMYRRQYRSRLAENRAAAYGQYADMAVIMEGIATELKSASGPEPLGERRLLRYLQSLDIDADVSVFRDSSGRLRAIIESGRLSQLTKESDYLEKLSGVLGVRLCRPGTDDRRAEGRILLMEAEPLAVSVGIAAMKKKGEPVSGDRGTYFKTDQGVLCVILSDGMGSGEEAARESIAAVRILERFLRSGVEPLTAMKILNSVMLLRNGEDWGYATVDLVCIDLFSGEASFYKYGAAPSYVRTGSLIRRVRCENFAAGMSADDGGTPDVVRIRMKPGSLAMIASDGVLAADDDAWLKKMMSDFDGTDTKTLAKQTLEAGIKKFGSEDDMTVLAVYVDKRA